MDIPILLAASHQMMVKPIQDMFAQTALPPGVCLRVLASSDIILKSADIDSVYEWDMLKHAMQIATRIRPNGWCAMADCTRLFITALDGLPGSLADPKWIAESAAAEDIAEYTLERMNKKSDRSAVFKTRVVLIDCTGSIYDAETCVSGTILEKVPETRRVGGCMPYASIFVPNNQGSKPLALGQMKLGTEETVAHWASAYRKMLIQCKPLLLRDSA